MASSTRTASASGSQGPTSKPACSGWSVASESAGRPELHDRRGEARGEVGQCGKAALGAVAAAADDQGPLRAGEDRGGLRDRLGGGGGGRRRRQPWRWRVTKIGQRRRQRLARQAEIDGAARRGHGDRERAVDDVFDLVAEAELVVPLDVLAQHGALVAHLLAPVDRQVARAEPARFGDRRAPGGEQDRHVLAGGVQEAHERVGHADVDVDHDRLRPAGREVVAMRHADRDRLVRGSQRLGHREAGGGARGQRLDHRARSRCRRWRTASRCRAP